MRLGLGLSLSTQNQSASVDLDSFLLQNGDNFQFLNSDKFGLQGAPTQMVSLGLGLGITRAVSTLSVASSDYLDGVETSTCFDLDATIADSYTSGQTWANLVETPADGASTSDYNVWLGDDGSATATDPTFTGTAGDSGAYFATDGGDTFRFKNTTTNAPLLNKLHQGVSENAWWLAFAFRHVSGSPGINLLDTRKTSGGTNTNGVLVQIPDAGILRLIRSVGGNTISSSTVTPVNGTDYLMIISRDEATDSVDFWVNSATVSTNVTSSWSASTADMGNALPSVLSQGISGYAPSGVRFYGMYGGNGFLDDSKAAAIRAHIATRHGRTY